MQQSEKRSTGSTIDWQKRRRNISVGVLPLFLERPWPSVSIEDIATRLGISYWQVYYSFDGQEDIYCSAVTQLVDTIVAEMGSAPDGGTTIHGVIRNYVRHTANIVGTESYKQLLFLLIRDEKENPWLRRTYQIEIGDPLVQGMEDAVANAGARKNLPVLLLHGTSERYLQKLEAALALPKLLYGDGVLAQEFERTVAAISKDVWSSTCAIDGLGRPDAAPLRDSASQPMQVSALSG